MFFDQTSYIKAGHVKTVAALNMACKKSVFNYIGSFNPKLYSGEDLEWILRGIRLGIRLFFEPNAKCYHHGNRKTLFELIDHSKGWGKNSILVRKKYSDIFYTPSLFFNSTLLYFLSPVIGALFATKIIFYPGIYKYFYTWPAIAIAKSAWCISAAEALKNISDNDLD